jgi:hypothetical protein
VNIQFQTVNFNNLVGLRKTAESILKFCECTNLSGLKIYWIIKDANSTDGSVEYLKHQVEQINVENLNIQIEISADKGIFNGMNCAISFAQDDMLTLFLNSGDYLSNTFIHNFKHTLFGNEDIVYGDYYINNESKKTLVKNDANIDFEYVISKMINHQSVFINSTLLKKHPFKEDYWVNADWVQLFDIMRLENPKIKYLNFAIPVYELGGNSDKHYQEGLNQREKYLKSRYSQSELKTLKTVARLRQRKWYDFLLKSLDSPKRGMILAGISKWMK